MSQRRGRSCASNAAVHEPEDVKTSSTTDRRVLRSHYRRLKASIAEDKEQLLHGDVRNFDAIVRRADDLHSLVNRPREQIADAEALLDITEAFLNSVKDLRLGGGIKASDLVSAIVQAFRLPGHLDDHGAIQLDWFAIGVEANAVFNDVPGVCTMLGPMDSEPKKRKVAATRRRGRGPVAETTRPQTVGDEGDQQTQTDKNVRTMFNVLRRCGNKGCELENLVLSRDSFAHTVENIFFLSFLVKDGRAQITIEDGKQFVACRNAPTAAERSGRHEPGALDQVINSQFVFRFDYKDWILMKELVEEGKELMPKRSKQAEPPQITAVSTPIRKNSRNRGRVTLSVPCEELDDGEDSEGDDADETADRCVSKRRIL